MTFTKTKKKTVDDKRANMEKVRDLVDGYSHVYVLDIQNFRNPLMKQLKQEWQFNGVFFCGKVKPTMVALGKDADTEYRDNLHLVSKALEHSAKGAHRGLFFTNNKPETVLPFFQKYKMTTFAKTGFVATKDYTLNKGVLSQFVFSQEYVLKKMGLPVLLKEGRLILNQDYLVCQKGQPLKPEQCKLLELLKEPMAEFYVTIYGYWTNNEYFEYVQTQDNEEHDEQKGMEEEDKQTQASFVKSSFNAKKTDSSNANQGNNNFLDAFIGDDDESSDEDMD